MPVPSLLPPNGKPFVRAFEQTLAYEPRVSGGIALVPDVKGRELPGWIKFLLYEYGLIELSNFVPNDYTLLADGRVWQIERDTFAAVARGLGWVGAPGTINEAPPARVWWNSFQLYLAALPAADAPNLERIDRVTQLSKPFRSDFRRGVFGYDAPALEGDMSRLDASLLDEESGVRLRAGGPLWSFGRVAEATHTLLEAEGTALGIWTPPFSDVDFLVNFLSYTGQIGEDPETVENLTNFARASGKYAQALDGSWQGFSSGQMALTDRGLSLEPAATRLSHFWLNAAPPMEDDDAAEVLATGLPDPLGGNRAIRVRFNDDGYVFYVPASGIVGSTPHGVSFFAKLVSTSGSGIDGILPDLVLGEWVRIEGALTTPAGIDGQWLDLTLLAPGAEVVVELFGFQPEAGAVTSPIEGDLINGTRAADELEILLPDTGAFNLTIAFDNGTAQPLLGVEDTVAIDPATLGRPYVVEIGSLRTGTWDSMAFPWTEANFPWDGDAAAARARDMAAWFDAHPEAYFRLKRGDGSVIGYRRVRVVRQVAQQFGGPFTFGGIGYAGDETGRSVLIEAMTDAGNGAGQTVAGAELIFNPGLAGGVPPGRLWLGPDDMAEGVNIAPVALSIPLRATVRERVKLMLRF